MKVFFKNIRKKILGTSLQRKTKILLFNIAIGFFLITGMTFISLVGLKHDYDSSFINQEQKLKQLIIIQNIYASVLAEFLRQNPATQEVNQLKKAWDDFSSMQETSNYGTRFKDFYAKIFLNYSARITDLSQSEAQIAQIINHKLSNEKTPNFTFFRQTALSLNDLLHKAIQLRIDILNLKKNSADSLFLTSLILIGILLALIILTTLFFSKIIISSIKDLHNSLEHTIYQQTRELREFNNDLQLMIEKEVKESRQKDHIMFQQARLASIGEMIQNIAHQWRQPLNSLTLIIQSFKIKFDHNKLSRLFIDTQTQNALRIAQNMSNTIENFRNFFQPHASRDFFSIQKSIYDSLNILQANLKNSNINVFVIEGEEICLFSYENAFTQVILNLVNNAKDAILAEEIQDGIIEISFCKNQDLITLEIRDNARGIKIKELEKIFEPYFTTKHKSVGTGVGLYMVKQIIEKQMEGKISVENQLWMSKITQQKYHGACFQIVFPVSPKQPQNKGK